MAAAAEDVVVLDSGSGNSASVHLFGATLISWKCQGEEHLFVSSKSLFDNKKAIRGGIPLVFPNFGPWDLGPQHGFARIKRWSVQQQPTKDKSGNVTATFTLEDDEQTRQMWKDNRFQLVYKVTISQDGLQTDFEVHNTGSQSFSFTCLLHTYFKVPDVVKTNVSGLQGLTYTDKVKGGEKAIEERELVTLAENVDRVYESTPAEHIITNVAGKRTLKLAKRNLPDTVIWNPWKEKAAAMSDFGNDDYPNMICVEAGRVTQPAELQPQEVFTASQTVSVTSQSNI